MRTDSSSLKQQGVSLIIVMVIMLLSSLLVLGGSRVAVLNEFLAGSESDQQRAFEAAQFFLKDAVLYIQDDRSGCPGPPVAPNWLPCNQRVQALSKIDNELLLDIRDAALASTTTQCSNGVCVNLGARTSGNPATSFWNDPALLTTYTANGVGARYGQHTGMSVPVGASSNPIVAANQAWYWIELLPFSGQAPDWALDCMPTKGSAQFLFRITALALGRSGVPTVVQELFVPKPEGNARRCPA